MDRVGGTAHRVWFARRWRWRGCGDADLASGGAEWLSDGVCDLCTGRDLPAQLSPRVSGGRRAVRRCAVPRQRRLLQRDLQRLRAPRRHLPAERVCTATPVRRHGTVHSRLPLVTAVVRVRTRCSGHHAGPMRYRCRLPVVLGLLRRLQLPCAVDHRAQPGVPGRRRAMCGGSLYERNRHLCRRAVYADAQRIAGSSLSSATGTAQSASSSRTAAPDALAGCADRRS